ncbi:MAG: hypothetical protein R3228_17560 [Halioglobus sp.]|nr:hypothetical protein [Halioglobus sp.]
MTQHIQTQDTLEDQATLRRLGIVIGCFMAATAVLAVSIGIIAG